MNDLQPILIPVDRVADMFGKCRRSIYNLIADGHLDALQNSTGRARPRESPTKTRSKPRPMCCSK